MPTYEINGQDVDAETPELAAQVYRSNKAAATQEVPQQGESPEPASPDPTPSQDTSNQPTPQDTSKINPADLKYDQDYLDAASVWYKMNNGKDYEGDAEGLASYGKDQMAAFNFRSFDLASDALKLRYLQEDQQKAFLYMLHASDRYDWSLEGAGRAAYYMATDPLNYTGLLSLGVGTAATQVGMQAAKTGIKALARVAVVNGLQGAMYNAAFDATRQEAEINANGKDGFDVKELLGSTALGGTAGAAIGAGSRLALDFAGSMLKRPVNRPTVDIGGAQGVELPQPEVPPSVAPLHETGPQSQAEPKGPLPAALPSPNEINASEANKPTFNEQLPPELAGAKPRYNYGQKGFELQFNSDVEKALFITSQANKSKADEAYRNFLKNNGFNDAEINQYGQQVRDHIKGLAKDGEHGDTLEIPNLIDRKTPNPQVPGNTVENINPGAAHLPPDVKTGNTALDTILDFVRNNGVHGTDDAANASREALGNVSREDMATLQSTVDHLAVNNPEDKDRIGRSIADATQQAIEKSKELRAAAEAATDPNERTRLINEWQAFSDLKDKLVQADTPLSSETGRTLANRVGNINTNENRGLTAESVLNEWGIKNPTPDDMTRAHQEVYDRYTAIEQAAKHDDAVQKLSDQIQQLYDAGDIAGAVRAGADKAALEAVVAEREAQQRGMLTTLAENGNTVLKALTEVVIGNVMSTGTLVRILIPSLAQTLYRPLFDALGRGLSYDAVRQMASTYSGMFFMNEFANRMTNPIRSAFQTGRYEAHFLTTDMDRFFERPAPIIPRWAGGGAIRIIPRMVEGLDEFFKQIHYRGAVVGNAMGDAIREGIEELGMTKGSPDLEAHIQNRVAQAVDQSFAKDIDAPRVIDYLRRQGISNGMTGDTLDKWVATELNKNGDLFREAQNQSAKSYSDDILFKREFSGDDNASKLAQLYEKATNSVPLIRLLGQLFFRTPVRLLELGTQITPGLNAIAQSIPGVSTKFFEEVRGFRGEQSQAKALGSVLMSYAVMGTFMYQYAIGNITGGGPELSAERRQLENTGDFRSYSIGQGDSSRFSFARLEPFNFPFKVIANAMERYGKLQQRAMQGEFVDHEEQQVLATLGVVFGSIAQAVHDSGIVEGASQWMDVAEMFRDPEKADDKWSRLMGQKAQMLIPHTFINAMKVAHPEMNDPVNVDQFVRSAINPSDPLVAKQYDPLGNVRRNPNPIAGLIGIDITPAEGLKQGKDDRDIKLNTWLANIEQNSGLSFKAPHSVNYPGFETWKDQDLRTTPLPSGKGLMMDKWMEEYNKTPVRDQLESLISRVQNQERVSGQPSAPGDIAKGIMEVLHANREVAFNNMIRNDQELFNQMRKGQDKRLEDATRPDVTFNPYGIGRPKF